MNFFESLVKSPVFCVVMALCALFCAILEYQDFSKNGNKTHLTICFVMSAVCAVWMLRVFYLV